MQAGTSNHTDAFEAPALNVSSVCLGRLADDRNFDCICRVVLDDFFRDLHIGESDLPSHLVIVALVFGREELQKVHLLWLHPLSFVQLSLSIDAKVCLLGKADLNNVINLFVGIEVEVAMVDVVDADINLVPLW